MEKQIFPDSSFEDISEKYRFAVNKESVDGDYVLCDGDYLEILTIINFPTTDAPAIEAPTDQEEDAEHAYGKL